MNYKIKSLLYLTSFIAMAIVYHQLSEDTDTEKEKLAIENTETSKEILVDTDYQY